MENGESSYRRFLAGDDEGMVELIRNYKDGLILYLCSITGDIDSAEECFQDTFIRLAVNKPHFSGRSSFLTWLYAIGRNMAVDRLRSLKRRRQTSLEDAAEISDGTDLERSYLMSERKVTLHRAMRNLKKEYQQVLWLTKERAFVQKHQ